MSNNTLKPAYPCRAMNPSTCPYHSPFMRLESASNYAEYEEAKKAVLEVQKKKRKLENIEVAENTNPDLIKAPGYMWVSGRESIVHSNYYDRVISRVNLLADRFEKTKPMTEEQAKYKNDMAKIYNKLGQESIIRRDNKDAKVVDTTLRQVVVAKLAVEALSANYNREEFKASLMEAKKKFATHYDKDWGSLSKMAKFNGAANPNANLRAIENANAYNAVSDMLYELNRSE